MHRTYCTALTLLLSLWVASIGCVELTFELADNAKDCFYQEIQKNVSVTFEYQVITGGQYDVDVEVISPAKQVIYTQTKNQYDSHTFTADIAGVYTVCFGNEFSTFSHKLIYMDLQVGEEAPLLEALEEHKTSMTQMEKSSTEIHKSLSKVADFQTHHRLREATGRKRGEDINERVLWWSIMETFCILVISIGEVLVLRNFFTDRTAGTSTKGYARM